MSAGSVQVGQVSNMVQCSVRVRVCVCGWDGAPTFVDTKLAYSQGTNCACKSAKAYLYADIHQAHTLRMHENQVVGTQWTVICIT